MTISLLPIYGKLPLAIIVVLLVTSHYFVSADRMVTFLRQIHSEDDAENAGFQWGKGFGKNGKGILLRLREDYFGKGYEGKGDSGKGYEGKGDIGKGQGKSDHGKGNNGKGDYGKGGSGKAGKGKTDSPVYPTTSPTPSADPNASLSFSPMAEPSPSPTSSSPTKPSAGPSTLPPVNLIPLEGGSVEEAGKGKTTSPVCPTKSLIPSAEPTAIRTLSPSPTISSNPTARPSAGPSFSPQVNLIPLEEDSDTFDFKNGLGNVFDSGKRFGKTGEGFSGIGKGKGKGRLM